MRGEIYLRDDDAQKSSRRRCDGVPVWWEQLPVHLGKCSRPHLYGPCCRQASLWRQPLQLIDLSRPLWATLFSWPCRLIACGWQRKDGSVSTTTVARLLIIASVMWSVGFLAYVWRTQVTLAGNDTVPISIWRAVALVFDMFDVRKYHDLKIGNGQSKSFEMIQVSMKSVIFFQIPTLPYAVQLTPRLR